MGNTRRYAEQINLITMQPQTDLSSTGFALADAGNEYLILQPSEAPDLFTIAPAPGAYAVEWHNLASGETVSGAGLTVRDTKIRISTPPEIAGPAVLHIRRVQS
jgi:hypothetical protein